MLFRSGSQGGGPGWWWISRRRPRSPSLRRFYEAGPLSCADLGGDLDEDYAGRGFVDPTRFSSGNAKGKPFFSLFLFFLLSILPSSLFVVPFLPPIYQSTIIFQQDALCHVASLYVTFFQKLTCFLFWAGGTGGHMK